jgi:hypothetical protein
VFPFLTSFQPCGTVRAGGGLGGAASSDASGETRAFAGPAAAASGSVPFAVPARITDTTTGSAISCRRVTTMTPSFWLEYQDDRRFAMSRQLRIDAARVGMLP